MPAHHRPPAPPDGDTSADLDAGRHPLTDDGRVPLAVWPALPATPDPARPAGVLPPMLADRLIATYTRPRQVVLAAGAGASVAADAAERAGRRPVLDTADRATAFPPLGSRRAALVVLTVPAVSTEAARYARWAATLTPGGILAVLAPAGHGPHTTRAGRITAAAHQAGLGYLQHIIAVLARLTGDRLAPVPTTDQLAQVRAAHAAGLAVHLPTHSDLLIFQRVPGAAEPAATPPPTMPAVGVAAAGAGGQVQEVTGRARTA